MLWLMLEDGVYAYRIGVHEEMDGGRVRTAISGTMVWFQGTHWILTNPRGCQIFWHEITAPDGGEGITIRNTSGIHFPTVKWELFGRKRWDGGKETVGGFTAVAHATQVGGSPGRHLYFHEVDVFGYNKQEPHGMEVLGIKCKESLFRLFTPVDMDLEGNQAISIPTGKEYITYHNYTNYGNIEQAYSIGSELTKEKTFELRADSKFSKSIRKGTEFNVEQRSELEVGMKLQVFSAGAKIANTWIQEQPIIRHRSIRSERIFNSRERSDIRTIRPSFPNSSSN